MRAGTLIIAIACAGFGGLVLGYFTDHPTADDTARTPAAPPPPPLKPVLLASPAWRPDLVESLDAAATGESFVALLNRILADGAI